MVNNPFSKYELGTIVYKLENRARRIDTFYGAGKITGILSESDADLLYLVDFIKCGNEAVPHDLLIPAKIYHSTTTFNDVVVAKFDCGNLISEGQLFIVKDEHLYSNDAALILSKKKFNHLFKNYDPL
jgi:hypothetical protein